MTEEEKFKEWWEKELFDWECGIKEVMRMTWMARASLDKPEQQEPRIGTLCEFWDDEGEGLFVGILSGVYDNTCLRYFCNDFGYDHCQEITDPTCIIKTLAPPEAAKADISHDGFVSYYCDGGITIYPPGDDGCWICLQPEQFGDWFGRTIEL